MKNITFKVIFGFCFFCLNPVFSQSFPEKVQQFFEEYRNETPPEKVYLQLDKHTYTLGEDVWFSAFLVAGSYQVPSPLSQTLYVDLFDGDGLLLEQKIIRLEKGRGNGDFTLPSFGKPGNYQIKAYTAWMRNSGEEFFFEGGFSVIDGAGGSFLPKITFSAIESSGGKATYRTELLAIDKSGNPLAGKALQMKVFGGDEEVHSQDLLLNEEGIVSFSFSIPEKPYPSQHVELIYLENENYSVSQKIRLPYSFNLADIQFLPEGGNWVVSKKSKIAFRAIAPDGNPLSILGTIAGTDISFESNFAGLGKFEITPDKQDYQAEISHPVSGQKRTINLPKASTDGLALQVINNPAASYLTAFIQGVSYANSLLLVSQTRGLINYMIEGKLTNGVWGVRIPKENLISGINQITVLTSEGTPLAERLIFIRKEENELKLDVNSNSSLNPREKIKLEITNQSAGNPASGSFSVSIVDAEQVSDESEVYGTIYSHLLLSSDLKGQIHQPGYYFQNQDESTLEALDLVMLTHGWRRFTWDQIAKNEQGEINYFIERGINIEGQISDQEDTRKGLSGGKITAMVGNGIEIVTTEFGSNGRFIIRDLDYQDSASVTLTAVDNRLKNFVDIKVTQPEAVFTGTSGNYSTEIEWPENLAATYEERALMRRMNEDPDILDLEGVTVEAQTFKKEDEEVQKIYGPGDVSIDPEKIPGSVGFTNVFQLIQGRVSGVKVFVSGLDVSVQIRGVGSINAGTGPLYLLDNIPVDANTLLQVNPRDVASVDVFKDPARAAIFGAQGANGVIAVYTKRGSGFTPSVGGTLVTTYGGYSVAKEFYQPNYDEKGTSTALNDKRATIFWKPILEIGEDGKANLEYFNTDVAKKHLIFIEGIDEEGRIGRVARILE